MAFGKWLVGGLVGGLIGAAVWVAIGYFMHAEVGIVAWGIGFLVGVGVRAAASMDEQDPSPAQGVLAAVLALLTIVGAKYVVVEMMVSDMVDELTEIAGDTDEIHMIVMYASNIAAEKADAGEKLIWPQESGDNEMPSAKDFPPGIWKAAEDEWNRLSKEEQQSEIEQENQKQKAALREFGEAFGVIAKKESFVNSFSAFDLLWCALALFTAYGVGYGSED